MNYQTLSSKLERFFLEAYSKMVDFSNVNTHHHFPFREGSVIADIQLRFSTNAVEPLSILERTIKYGKCGDLELDANYFKILMPDLSKRNLNFFISLNLQFFDKFLSNKIFVL